MNIFLFLSMVILLSACGSGGTQHSDDAKPIASPSPVSESPSALFSNQVGYPANGYKSVWVASSEAGVFSLKRAETDESVFEARYDSPREWGPAGDMRLAEADFSSWSQPGRYYVQAGETRSPAFDIVDDPYQSVLKASIKAYYFNRASTALEEAHAGVWARPAGHPDEEVMIHKNAASDARPEGSRFAAPKGWYDAGDFGKYIVNSGISTYTLMAAYRDAPAFYDALELGIPESGNDVADLLDEVMWNLDWMEAMQDPNDGGVYHKLTTLRFSGILMPDAANEQRYFIEKSTAATLDFAATMAMAARVYAPLENDFPGRVERYRRAAELAWQWALANPDRLYEQGPDSEVKTGAYGDDHLEDEWAWASAELFLTTGEASYLAAFKQHFEGASVPNWGNVAMLGLFSLINEGREVLSIEDYSGLESQLLNLADTLVQRHEESGVGIAMRSEDFVWGSNAVILNTYWVLSEAQKIDDKPEYAAARQGLLDFVLGRNPTGYAFVTGFGTTSPMHIHHRASEADDVVEPVPGFVAGGPQPGQQDGCDYISVAAARSYVDHWCSYASNEVAINWNAPLVMALTAQRLLK